MAFQVVAVATLIAVLIVFVFVVFVLLCFCFLFGFSIYFFLRFFYYNLFLRRWLFKRSFVCAPVLCVVNKLQAVWVLVVFVRVVSFVSHFMFYFVFQLLVSVLFVICFVFEFMWVVWPRVFYVSICVCNVLCGRASCTSAPCLRSRCKLKFTFYFVSNFVFFLYFFFSFHNLFCVRIYIYIYIYICVCDARVLCEKMYIHVCCVWASKLRLCSLSPFTL